MSAAKSSYLQIYDQEERKDDFKWQIENKQAGVSIKDSKSGRPMKFYADNFKFYNGGAAPGPGYDLKQRFDAVEADSAGNTSAHGSNATSISNESTRAQQAEAVNSAAVSSANSARGVLQQALEAADTAANVKVNQEIADRASAVSAESSARAAAVLAEKQRAEAAEAAIQGQITNILGTSPAHLDSLQEVVAAFQSADGTLSGTVGSMDTRLAAVEALLDELLNQA